MAFNPKDHIIKMGNREYLETKWRLVWFREVHPLGRIETDIFTAGDLVYVKAIIVDGDNHVLASGMATIRDATQREATWAGRIVEKAETAAIGRALAVAGFGTQFQGSEDDEGEHLADSPIERKQAPKQSKPAPAKDPLDPDTHLGAKPEKELQYTDAIKVLEVKLDKNNKEFISADGITIFTRQPFRDLGYPQDLIDKLGKVGQVFLPEGKFIRIAYSVNGKFKTAEKIHRIDTEETVSAIPVRN